jgi:hypothetical protein
MNAATIEHIEGTMDRAAAALFAAAVAYATFAALRWSLPALQVSGFAGLAAVGAFLLCSRVMTLARRATRSLPVPIFDLRELEPFGADELLLTESDIVAGELLLTEADRVRDELLLTEADRVLPADQPVPVSDSRVVQLFDRVAMPTPGELKSRVDNHLAEGSARPAPSDASQALAAALAELRRSLR